MRHLGSIALSIVLAPVIFVLVGVGQAKVALNLGLAQTRWSEFGIGVAALLVAAACCAVLTLTRVSPAGPALIGLVFLAVAIVAVAVPSSILPHVGNGLFGVRGDTTLPLQSGVLMLIAVPLLATVFSARRWRGGETRQAAQAESPPHGYGPPTVPVQQPYPRAAQADPFGTTPVPAQSPVMSSGEFVATVPAEDEPAAHGQAYPPPRYPSPPPQIYPPVTPLPPPPSPPRPVAPPPPPAPPAPPAAPAPNVSPPAAPLPARFEPVVPARTPWSAPPGSSSAPAVPTPDQSTDQADVRDEPTQVNRSDAMPVGTVYPSRHAHDAADEVTVVDLPPTSSDDSASRPESGMVADEGGPDAVERRSADTVAQTRPDD
ncbi:MAG TPA: hypothetical protein VFR11_15475 [Micromonosporaceae bacterium]|jgi:hypothetical protein|nr:hypothetical protein [Micromonosporaceae bacterium]